MYHLDPHLHLALILEVHPISLNDLLIHERPLQREAASWLPFQGLSPYEHAAFMWASEDIILSESACASNEVKCLQMIHKIPP